MNILDYVHWRGDLSFDERELNEIDSLILSVLSYENFDEILTDKRSRTVNETAQLFFAKYDEENLKKRISMTNRSYELLKEAAKTKRFGDLKMMHYINEVDETLDLQFSAVTFSYKDQWEYIAFRGTDDTIIGWKEDFAMAYRDEVLSQRKAVEYLKNVTAISLNPNVNYFIGGHSKGGNLAMYASAFVNEDIQKRIKRIDNFDGPGFDETIWQNSSFQNIIPMMNTYIPSGSLFGRLFAHSENVTILKSEQSGLWQHDAFSWQVSFDKFIYEHDITHGSQKAIAKLNGMLDEYSSEECEVLVESLFNTFLNLNIHTLTDLTHIDIAKVIKAIRELGSLDGRTRKALIDMLEVIWDVSEILPF